MDASEQYADVDKLVHELEMRTDIDTEEIVSYTRQRDCFVCALMAWVRDNADRYAFGPELCITDRLELVHHDVDNLHVANRLESHIGRCEAVHAERMLRLERATEFYEAEAERLEARSADLAEKLREFRETILPPT